MTLWGSNGRAALYYVCFTRDYIKARPDNCDVRDAMRAGTLPDVRLLVVQKRLYECSLLKRPHNAYILFVTKYIKKNVGSADVRDILRAGTFVQILDSIKALQQLHNLHHRLHQEESWQCRYPRSCTRRYVASVVTKHKRLAVTCEFGSSCRP